MFQTKHGLHHFSFLQELASLIEQFSGLMSSEPMMEAGLWTCFIFVVFDF